MRSSLIILFLCVSGISAAKGNKKANKFAAALEPKLNDIIASIASLSDDPEWELVFKAVAGIAPVGNTDKSLYDPVDVWSRDEPLNEDVPAARKLDNSFKGHYKSQSALNWGRRNIMEVKVAFLDATGKELMSMIFDGEGSNDVNWFTKARLLYSPYDDIVSGSQNYFSVAGAHNRRFFINRNYGGCEKHAGWMAVIGKNYCSWEYEQEAKPIFLYSTTRTYANWNKVEDVGRADLFAIFVKTKSRYCCN
ncbi:uncharacterized protein [Amphiura filiformis]|uniref:uncharacterized protein n=1 Tax=Amphiura filiformis TaxID=82378 RepID=UPI003B20FD90